MRVPEVDYEALFEANPVALLALTPSLIVVAVNRQYTALTGRSAAELIGHEVISTFPKTRNRFDAEAKRNLRASLTRVVATGKEDAMALQRYDIERKDQPGVFQPRYWSAINSPVFGPDGRLQLIIHRVMEVTPFLHDLQRSRAHRVYEAPSDLQAMEVELYVRARQLQEANQELREAHAREHAMAETLRQANAREQEIAAALRQTVERQQRFISDATHDLRNPISGLQARLEVALYDLGEDTNQAISKALHDVERLNDIVADLLELARLDAAAPVPTQILDLADLVAEELKCRDYRVPIVPDLHPPVTVNANRQRLWRLLANLLANAERHAASRVYVIVTARPPHAILEVVDDGPGIPPDEREQIFQRFYRRSDAQRLDPAGTGLGLSICRDIAHAHGGRLHVLEKANATPAAGARLVLELPLSPAATRS